MGNLGVVTHGYISLSDLSKEMTYSVIVLKKSYYNLSKDKKIKPETVGESKKILLVLLTHLQNELSSDRVSDKIALPTTFVEEVRATHRSSLSYFLKEDNCEANNSAYFYLPLIVS